MAVPYGTGSPRPSGASERLRETTIDDGVCDATDYFMKAQNEKKRPLFYVELSETTTLNKNSIVKFDTEFIDEGNNFNTGDGIFVAPIAGFYLFSWNVQTYTSKSVETELRVDNIVKGKQLMAL
ncbi:uncharacterized protein LOC134684713 [Mytilus trossulus]|uniref:uncharacterized protein LOC134684713 n=1 Tax=Mytilus trossulus TaxID=6551 RepID=UPI003004CA76